jgi:hypothetical protein
LNDLSVFFIQILQALLIVRFQLDVELLNASELPQLLEKCIVLRVITIYLWFFDVDQAIDSQFVHLLLKLLNSIVQRFDDVTILGIDERNFPLDLLGHWNEF